jgi:hypothetical protein
MFFLAEIAHAQVFQKVQANPVVNSLVTKIMDVIVLPAVEGLFIFTFLIFIWGVVGFIRNKDDATARTEGGQHILWGVIGMFIMISAYGIIRVIANTVGVGDPFQ